MTQLAAQTALVTGANRGLGREFVHQLLERGVAMVYAAARDPQAIVVTDSRVVPLQLDVTDLASVARAAEFADDVSVVVMHPRSRSRTWSVRCSTASRPERSRSWPTT
jgi:NAD(P)-dependent dehydrogenase (short-subunit alcohol dehydrogenase family)